MVYIKWWTFYLFLISNAAMAQTINSNDIVGEYKLPSRSPEGGTSFCVLPDNKFVAVYFGGYISGTWAIEGNSVIFTAEHEPHIFTLYGRHSKQVEGTSIFFDGFEDTTAKISFGDLNEFKRVFNEQANCFDFPYIHEIKDAMSAILLTTQDQYRQRKGPEGTETIYQFENDNNYNEFIVFFVKSELSRQNNFTAAFTDGTLVFEDNQKAAKRDLSMMSEEDKSFITSLSNRVSFPDTKYYSSEYFGLPTEQGLTIENYTYDKENDRYINPNFQSEYLEIQHYLEMYSFHRIRNVEIKNELIKIKPGQLFTAKCD